MLIKEEQTFNKERIMDKKYWSVEAVIRQWIYEEEKRQREMMTAYKQPPRFLFSAAEDLSPEGKAMRFTYKPKFQTPKVSLRDFLAD